MSPTLKILHGDALAQLRTLPDCSVHMCVTSPPYWGLRAYLRDGHPDKHLEIGSEPTPEAFVAKMVEVFREVRRVLREDGTCWLNLGDSYANDGKWGGATGGKHVAALHGEPIGRSKRETGLKPKDLVGIPWRVALALQADGWYLRSDIIWHKPNPMPESVTDRPTKAHEYLFLLVKSERYFFDAEAIKDPVTNGAHARGPGNVNPPNGQAAYENGDGLQRTKAGLLAYAQRQRAAGVTPKSAEPGSGVKANASFHAATTQLVSSRNKRTVWTVEDDEFQQFIEWKRQRAGDKPDVWQIATAPYSEAHFATFPPALVKPCILAGTSPRGVCPTCGAPWERMMEDGEIDREHQRACGADSPGGYNGKATKDYGPAKCQDPSAVKARILAGMVKRRTIDWKPSCRCVPIEDTPDPISATVLDPFFGSGTTGQVSLELGRSCIGIELNDAYLPLAEARINVTPGLAL